MTRGDVGKGKEGGRGACGWCFYKSGAPFGSGGVAAFVGEIFGTILSSGLSGSEASNAGTRASGLAGEGVVSG